MAGARGGSSCEVLFLQLPHLVTIVLRLVGTNGFVGRGLAVLGGMALEASELRKKGRWLLPLLSLCLQLLVFTASSKHIYLYPYL